jgi:quinol monooxygenase YgiN
MDNNQIHFRAELTIKEGKTEEFKKLIQDLSKVVEANELDTIEYQFYVNGSETKCIVHETYRNSEAAITHNNGVASQKILPRIFNISKITRFDVYGNPSEELQKVLTSVRVQTYYNLFVGFSRH